MHFGLLWQSSDLLNVTDAFLAFVFGPLTSAVLKCTDSVKVVGKNVLMIGKNPSFLFILRTFFQVYSFYKYIFSGDQPR